MKRKGWFAIPGVQEGDRTLEEQMEAVRLALAEAPGRTVLDLGCAEGLVGREFARAGAKQVLGVDSLRGHIEVAQKVCAGLPMKFIVSGLEELAAQQTAGGEVWQYDIVLALGVTHKLQRPDVGVTFAARASRDLVLYRAKGGVRDGIVRSKHFKNNFCDAHAIMREHRFELERVVEGGGRGETVEYWRRKALPEAA